MTLPDDNGVGGVDLNVESSPERKTGTGTGTGTTDGKGLVDLDEHKPIHQSMSADRATFSIPELLNLSPGLTDRRKSNNSNSKVTGLKGLHDLPPRNTSLVHRRTTSLEGQLINLTIRKSSFPIDSISNLKNRPFSSSGRASSIAQTRGITIAAVRSSSSSVGNTSPGVYSGGGGGGGGSGSLSPTTRKSSIGRMGELISPGPMSASSFRSMAEEIKGVPRTDIILCKFYHVEGLTCTARPCRFVHELPPLSSPTTNKFRTASISTSDPRDSIQSEPTINEVEGEEGIEDLVEVYPMSGGGTGPKGRLSMAKYRTFPCKDFAIGTCLYGKYCSFLHEIPDEQVNGNGEDDEKTHIGSTDDKNVESLNDQPIDNDVPAVLVGSTTDRTPSAASAAPSARRFIPTKFTKPAITVPEYRWTKNEGLHPNLPSSATTENFKRLPEVIDWTAELSPRTVVTPAQWASAPPQSVWVRGPPSSLQSRRTVVDEKIDGDNGPTPTLPITAYTFDTTSTPVTPQDTVTIQFEHGHPVYSAFPAISMGGSSYRPHVTNHADELAPDSLPQSVIPQQRLCGEQSYEVNPNDTPVAPWNDKLESMWQMGYTLGWNSFADAQSYEAQAQVQADNEVAAAKREGMPQLGTSQLPVAAARFTHGLMNRHPARKQMNYKTRLCQFYVEGTCPHGDNCTYKHGSVPKSPRTLAWAMRGTRSTDKHLYKTVPCKYFNSLVGCENGDECPFIHELVVPNGIPMILKPRPWRTKPCRHYQRGTCFAGENCAFAHVFIGTGNENISKTKPAPARPERFVRGAVPSRGREHGKDPKTVPCRWYQSEQGCRYGGVCQFRHDVVESSTTEGQEVDRRDSAMDDDDDDIEVVQGDVDVVLLRALTECSSSIGPSSKDGEERSPPSSSSSSSSPSPCVSCAEDTVPPPYNRATM